MQGYDIIMLGLMAIAIFRGYTKGLAWQISSIASIVVSYFVAYRFKEPVAAMIEMADPWRGLVAMMALFVGSSLVIWLLFHSLRGAIEKAKLKDFDQQLGAIFGGVKGAVWCTVVTLIALSLLSPAMSKQIVSSRSGGYIARLLASSKRIIPSEVQQVVQPYIQRAEDKLNERLDALSDPQSPFDPELPFDAPSTIPSVYPEIEDYWRQGAARNNPTSNEISTTNDGWR